jgi:hypothetical protein
MGGLANRYGHHGEDKNIFPLLRLEPQFFGRPARSLVAVANELSRLLQQECLFKVVPVLEDHATPRHATPRHATPRHATTRHDTTRHATPRHAKPRRSTAPRILNRS